MNYKRFRNERRSHDLMSLAIDLGMDPSRARTIIKRKDCAFLGKVVRIVENDPGEEAACKVIENAASVQEAASVLGSWVLHLTPNINTLRAALKYYLQHKGDTECCVRLKTEDGSHSASRARLY